MISLAGGESTRARSGGRRWRASYLLEAALVGQCLHCRCCRARFRLLLVPPTAHYLVSCQDALDQAGRLSSRETNKTRQQVAALRSVYRLKQVAEPPPEGVSSRSSAIKLDEE